jgi:hypothetical protein
MTKQKPSAGKGKGTSKGAMAGKGNASGKGARTSGSKTQH